MKSHNDSKYNEAADGYAKIAASLVRYLSNYHTICRWNDHHNNNHHIFSTHNTTHNKCTCIWCPNECIAYTTVNEINYMIRRQEHESWERIFDRSQSGRANIIYSTSNTIKYMK